MERINKIKNFIPFFIVLLLIVWLSMLVSDYLAVMISLGKPLFARPVMITDGGGSGIYRGAGYSFEIVGEFMPEAKVWTVVYAEFYFFGFRVNSVAGRDLPFIMPDDKK